MARLERIVERLELKEFQLRALLDVTKAINNNVAEEELVGLYHSIVKEQLGITKLMLHVNSDGWRTVLSYGGHAGMADADIQQAASWYKTIQVIGGETPGGIGAFDVAVPVYHREKPLAFLLIGDIDEEEQRISPTIKHLNFIQTLTNLIVVAMENRRLAQQELQQERDRREMELAAEMQSMLIPRDLPKGEHIEAAGWYQPHRQVGGDYYDLFHISPEKVVICVADVSGKGIAASLLMSNFQANLRAALIHSNEALPVLVKELNQRVHSSARGERFITLFIGILDLPSGEMHFVNAGHNAPLLFQEGRIIPLHDGSIALGMMPMLPFIKEGSVMLEPGSMFICFTDGLVEQEDHQEQAFETAPLENALRTRSKSGPQAVLDQLKTDFEKHRDSLPFLDDIAVLVCRYR
jgi:sigma-B regulation protein RsbU (phosphoserine phosphatase)